MATLTKTSAEHDQDMHEIRRSSDIWATGGACALDDRQLLPQSGSPTLRRVRATGSVRRCASSARHLACASNYLIQPDFGLVETLWVPRFECTVPASQSHALHALAGLSVTLQPDNPIGLNGRASPFSRSAVIRMNHTCLEAYQQAWAAVRIRCSSNVCLWRSTMST